MRGTAQGWRLGQGKWDVSGRERQEGLSGKLKQEAACPGCTGGSSEMSRSPVSTVCPDPNAGNAAVHPGTQTTYPTLHHQDLGSDYTSPP